MVLKHHIKDAYSQGPLCSAMGFTSFLREGGAQLLNDLKGGSWYEGSEGEVAVYGGVRSFWPPSLSTGHINSSDAWTFSLPDDYSA